MQELSKHRAAARPRTQALRWQRMGARVRTQCSQDWTGTRLDGKKLPGLLSPPHIAYSMNYETADITPAAPRGQTRRAGREVRLQWSMKRRPLPRLLLFFLRPDQVEDHREQDPHHDAVGDEDAQCLRHDVERLRWSGLDTEADAERGGEDHGVA